MNETTKKDVKGAGQVMTPTFRVSFPAVFAPKSNENNPAIEPKYSITMLFDISGTAHGNNGKYKADLTEMKAAVRAAIVEKWGADQKKWPSLRLPFRKGEEKDYDGYGAGIVFVSATSKQRPGLVDQAVKPIIDPSEFYGGCYARATINAFAYDKAGNRGVSFGLRNVQKIADGEPFSGKNKPENDFDSIATPAAATTGKTEAASDIDDLGL